jgi:hypothetical protein
MKRAISMYNTRKPWLSSHNGNFETTLEELGDGSITLDVEVNYDYIPEEKQTYDSPGYPSHLEYCGVKVKKAYTSAVLFTSQNGCRMYNDMADKWILSNWANVEDQIGDELNARWEGWDA